MVKTCRVLLVVTVMVTFGAVDAGAGGFMKMGEIKGESTAEGHEKWIDVLSIDWGFKREQNPAGGGRSGRLEFHDLVVVKAVDSTSPSIMLKCAEGARVPRVVLDLPLESSRGVGGIRVVMMNAMVTAVHIMDSETGERPTEHVSINFTEVKVIYKGPFGFSEFGWDIMGGTAL